MSLKNLFKSILGKKERPLSSRYDQLNGYTPKVTRKGADKLVERPKLTLSRAKRPCAYCSLPMFVSVGQKVNTHRVNPAGVRCRELYRSAYFYAARGMKVPKHA